MSVGAVFSSKKIKARASISLGFLECLLFPVLYIGWPNLAYVYKKEGLFSHRCDTNETITTADNGIQSLECSEQDEYLNLCLNIAAALHSCSSFAVGSLFDRYGLWVTRGVGS